MRDSDSFQSKYFGSCGAASPLEAPEEAAAAEAEALLLELTAKSSGDFPVGLENKRFAVSVGRRKYLRLVRFVRLVLVADARGEPSLPAALPLRGTGLDMRKQLHEVEQGQPLPADANILSLFE